MSKAKVSELLLEALNRCLPLTDEDEKGCGNCKGLLTESDIGVMLEDIDWQRQHGSLGDSCDVQVWEQFEEWLKEQKGESK